MDPKQVEAVIAMNAILGGVTVFAGGADVAKAALVLVKKMVDGGMLDRFGLNKEYVEWAREQPDVVEYAGEVAKLDLGPQDVGAVLGAVIGGMLLSGVTTRAVARQALENIARNIERFPEGRHESLDAQLRSPSGPNASN